MTQFRRDLNQNDWIGDAFLTVVFGGVAIVSVFLPWANVDTRHDVNFSLSKPGFVKTALQTSYGAPALWLGIVVVALGALMVVFGARRLLFWPGLATIAAAIAMIVDCALVAHTIYGPFKPGVGLFVLTLAGILLVPIGFASAAVGYWVGVRQRRAAPVVAGDGVEQSAAAGDVVK